MRICPVENVFIVPDDLTYRIVRRGDGEGAPVYGAAEWGAHLFVQDSGCREGQAPSTHEFV